MNNIERFIREIVWSQLQSIGFFLEKKSVSDLTLYSKLDPMYRRWFEATIEIFLNTHYLMRTEDSYFVVNPTLLDLDLLWEQWEEEKKDWIQNDKIKALVRLLEVALKALPDILSGKVAAIDVLFPNSSMELMEGVYKNNEVADYFNEVLANAVVAYVEERLKADAEARVKIFEIGAGTGGTSARIFHKLCPYQEHIDAYCYTDISMAFLLHAEKEYGPANPYLTYRIFNVEDPIPGQGIEPGSYDLVVAANVLHATKNIRHTLRHTKAILKHRGLLLLNEINSHNLFSHLTFGLLEGWWRFEDPQLRIPGGPGLSYEIWRKVLDEEGFSPVICLTEEIQKPSQQIIVAESNGIVRQQRLLLNEIDAINNLPKQKYVKSKQVNKTRKVEDSLFDYTLHFVKTTLSKTIKLAFEKIEVHATFEKYGIDSILQVNFIKELEKGAGELPKTVLFEHSNIEELVKYLIEHHADILRQRMPNKEEALSFHRPQPALDRKNRRLLKPEEPFFKLSSHLSSKETPPFKLMACSLKEHEAEDIAIIGMSGRYPLSHDLEELWTHLEAGKNCLTEVPLSRQQTFFNRRQSKDSSDKNVKKNYGGFLEEIDCFDHQLFEIKPQQVMELPPEVRLFLEIAWETCENGGYSKHALSVLQKKYQLGVGVFVGNMYNQYFWNIPSLEQALLSSNGTDWNIANRISHFFNLTGPSLAINTACSSSLYAVHLACESLKQKDCSMAIAGGVNLTLNLSKYDLLKRANFLGGGDKSKSFGISEGLIPGEGVGAVLLKLLSRALEDGDHIHAVIKGSFVNHSGGRQMYTAPDPEQQAQLMIYSMQKAGVDPSTIGYIESAANGSELGDSIEVIALNKAFAQCAEKRQFCPLGSIKSNLGHLEAASGISQLHKVILQMKHATLVPTLHAHPVNPNIKLENTPFYLQETKQPWEELIEPQNGERVPRKSMINSFGAGGSYANLIVEEYCPHPSEQRTKPSGIQEFLFVFSAKTIWSLFKYIEKIEIFIRQNPSIDVNVISRSLQKINHGLEHRVALVAFTRNEVLEKLTAVGRKKQSSLELNIYTSLDIKQPAIHNNDLSLEEMTLPHLAHHWVAGALVDFNTLVQESFSWCELPGYVFDHHSKFNFDEIHCGPDWDVENLQDPESEIYAYDEPYLKSHQLNGKQVLVGAVCPSLAIRAYFKTFPEEKAVCIEKLNYISIVEVKKNQKVEIKIIPVQKEMTFEFQVLYRYAITEAWRIMANGQLKKGHFEEKKIDLPQLINSLEVFRDLNLIYKHVACVEWGEVFKRITHLHMKGKDILAKVDLNDSFLKENHNYSLSPIITNCAYLAMLYLVEREGIRDAFLPFGIQAMHFKNNNNLNVCWISVKLIKNTEELLLFDVDVTDENGDVFLSYRGYSLKRNSRLDQKKVEQEKTLVRASSHTAPVVDALFGRIQKYLSDKLVAILGDNLSLNHREETNLMELGLESSQLINLTREIERETDIELNLTLFFEYPNIREITQFFFQKHKNAFLSMLDATPKGENMASVMASNHPNEGPL